MPVWDDFACPGCRARLEQSSPGVLSCAAHSLSFRLEDGIWRFLLPERQAHYARFIQEYETIRHMEGRESSDPAYYRSLPFNDLSGRMAADWQIRWASYESLVEHVIQPMEHASQPQLRILDLGAGNGWLSYQLARRGHRVGAVDLTVNDFDGLGCHRYYDAAFTPLQAEFDHLPVPDQTADMVVFNAALHYSEDYRQTMRESLRVIRPAGLLAILDTPVYHAASSGRQMVAEREAGFRKKYGFPSNALTSQNYLTYHAIMELGEQFHLQWEIITPAYGWGWRLRPLKARLLNRREPARFHLLVGRRAG